MAPRALELAPAPETQSVQAPAPELMPLEQAAVMAPARMEATASWRRNPSMQDLPRSESEDAWLILG